MNGIEHVPAWFADCMMQLRETFERSVIPIYAGGPNRMYVNGTGTLFRIDDARFLVTAAHVADVRTAGTLLAISDLPDGSKLRSLSEDAWLMGGLADVAVFELRPSTVETLRHRAFLTLADVDFSTDACPPGAYCAHGMPIEISTFEHSPVRRVKPRRFTAGSPLIVGVDVDHYDPQWHLLLNLDRWAPMALRSYEGMSGCSVWRLFPGEGRPEGWTHHDARVVGVQTSQLRIGGAPRYLRATKWSVVVGLILRAGS